VSSASAVGGVYVSRRGYQPTCVGTDDKGELVWEYRMKEPWHQKLFPVPYGGDFGVQWMYKSLQEKGFDSEDTDA
jgi:hypothetical protein